jgi:thioredoxin reductase (NADPH)
MAKPVILAVDDPQVLRAVERDLRRKYAREYRELRAGSGESALDTLGKLKLVDQRMPRMAGVEFLEEAIEQFPGAKRALLTAYSDTEAAIRAINEVGPDYYLRKPWDPPEQNLYPNLDDILGDWHADYRPLFEGIRVVGDRWSPTTRTASETSWPATGSPTSGSTWRGPRRRARSSRTWIAARRSCRSSSSRTARTPRRWRTSRSPRE